MIKANLSVLKFGIVGMFFFVLGGILWPRLNLGVQATPVPKVEGSESVFSPIPSSYGSIKVTKVIDGDTIVLSSEGRSASGGENGEVVRYIGIDTPEITKTPDCFAIESSNKNKELVLGKEVRLEKDVSEKDRYGRLLRYVYVGDTFVNDYLVRRGYSKVSTYPPDVKYSKQFVGAEKEARENNRGRWKECSISPSPSETAKPETLPLNPDLNINCSSNAYNCSDFKTQADAQNIFETCGGTSNDIHKLDRDGDGRVCETPP